MDNVKGALVLLVLVLGAACFAFLLHNRTLASQVADARVLSEQTIDLIKLQNVRCEAAPGEFTALGACIEPLLRTKDFKEESFAQPNAKTGAPGYLVIKNINRRSYAAENFTFLHNRVETRRGCTISGAIDYNVVCRFDLAYSCEDGDVLEVFYPVQGERTRVFLKTC